MKVSMDDDDEMFESTPWMIGCCYVLSGYVEDDIIERLYKAVEEVTGKPITRESRKIGFY